jgi:glycogen debranching enzyme
VVDAEGGGNDDACRPNQVLAISLDHAVLDESRWKKVMDVVTERLLTPVGLRSLAPGHPDYKAKYYGDLRSRDAAYHQGTVWAWLIGPYVDAYLRLHPEELSTARKFLEGFIPHWMRHASVPSAKFLTPKPPIRPAGASRNRGAWRRYCVAG